jgi:hypothetical protein
MQTAKGAYLEMPGAAHLRGRYSYTITLLYRCYWLGIRYNNVIGSERRDVELHPVHTVRSQVQLHLFCIGDLICLI